MVNLVIGCGYLGLRAARQWLKAGREVVALTRSSEHAKQFEELGITPIIGDVLNPETLQQLPAVETMLYAVGYDRSQPHSQRKVTVNGLKNTLAEISARCERVLYISSTSVYGQGRGEWIDEASECNPVRENGRICLDAELLLKNYVLKNQLPQAAILRCAGIYGQGRLLRRIEQLKTGEPIPGRPDIWLNLIHVDDALQSVLAAEQFLIAQPDSKLNCWLVADDRPIQRLVYYAVLSACLKLDCPDFVEEPQPKNKYGTNKRCRNDLMKQDLALTLTYPTIEAGLPQAVGTTNL